MITSQPLSSLQKDRSQSKLKSVIYKRQDSGFRVHRMPWLVRTGADGIRDESYCHDLKEQSGGSIARMRHDDHRLTRKERPHREIQTELLAISSGI